MIPPSGSVDELVNDLALWHTNASIAQSKVSELKGELRTATFLVWMLVKKAGGEVRFSDFERGQVLENWELIESLDLFTHEFVLRARVKPTPDTPEKI
jgi:hypothetical protein